MTTTEPDQDVTAALGAALAEPHGPLILPRDEWDALVAIHGQLSRVLGLGSLARVVAEAVAAEKKRIAQVAEDVGAHYHDGEGGQSASFAALLRGTGSA